jgi:hypothetical protein
MLDPWCRVSAISSPPLCTYTSGVIPFVSMNCGHVSSWDSFSDDGELFECAKAFQCWISQFAEVTPRRRIQYFHALNSKRKAITWFPTCRGDGKWDSNYVGRFRRWSLGLDKVRTGGSSKPDIPRTLILQGYKLRPFPQQRVDHKLQII